MEMLAILGGRLGFRGDSNDFLLSLYLVVLPSSEHIVDMYIMCFNGE